mgnify:CR=1 FL=1
MPRDLDLLTTSEMTNYDRVVDVVYDRAQCNLPYEWQRHLDTSSDSR